MKPSWERRHCAGSALWRSRGRGCPLRRIALSVWHGGLLVGCFLKEGETGATLPFRLRGLKNMPGALKNFLCDGIMSMVLYRFAQVNKYADAAERRSVVGCRDFKGR